MVAAGLVLFVGLFAVWAAVVDDPLGGEPSALIATGLDAAPASLPKVVAGNTTGPQGPRRYDGPGAPAPAVAVATAEPAAPAASAKTITIIDGSTGKRQEVSIAGGGETRAAPGEQRLLENSPQGALPRIAADGVRPAEAYARPIKLLPGGRDGPHVAIVLAGLGVSDILTQRALDKLPGPVTFAFMPYAADVAGIVATARASGHEILLQAPMEPFDYPDNDPGPQTLLTTLSAKQNIDRLHWLMSRFQGYVGLAGMMGARFTANEMALGPVLKETAKRGLIYVDDGSSPRSLAAQIAGANNMSFVKAEVTIDAVPTAAHIDGALAKLEALAREHGSATGFASALPTSIDRIAEWAKAAAARGIVLVPITAAALKPKSS